MTGRHDFLNSLFTPGTIAVVGASNDERKKGSLVLRNLRKSYRGKIFAVHPTADTVDGLAVYRSVADIPTEIDLLIPLIPAQNLMELVRDCPPGHVKTLLAIPSGFGEIPPDGARIEREMVSIATSKGMRVVGAEHRRDDELRQWAERITRPGAAGRPGRVLLRHAERRFWNGDLHVRNRQPARHGEVL